MSQKTFTLTEAEPQLEVVEQLPTLDNGYFDTLVAIGFAALADAYFDTPGTPLIRRTPSGFEVTYHRKPRYPRNLDWLKYTVAASWKSKKDWRDGTTLKAPGWDGSQVIDAEQAFVDTSDETKIDVEIRGKVHSIPRPERTLYGVINKLGKPDWVNLCVYACRHRGIELLDGEFEEESITFNSIVLPQASKGANASSSFSIGNSSLPKSFSRKVSRMTCLAVAGLIRCATGQLPVGFAVPVPREMRLEDLVLIAEENRARFISGGFFFPYDNYLNYLKLLLIHEFERHSLGSVVGANFVDLGTQSSPGGSWQLAVPKHKYSVESAERLQFLLYRWRKALTPRPGSDPSVDRTAVHRLVRGFERSDPLAAAEGYLSYIHAVGLNDGKNKYYPLNERFFEEIMSYDTNYSRLLEAFQRKEVRNLINLVRQDTYNAVHHGPDQQDRQPNYQMIRKLREVQSMEDLLTALTDIMVERGTTILALSKSENEQSKQLFKTYSQPLEDSIHRIVQLAEDYRNPRLIAQLILAFALSRRQYEQDTTELDEEPDTEVTV